MRSPLRLNTDLKTTGYEKNTVFSNITHAVYCEVGNESLDNICAVQQYTQSDLISEFYSALVLARHVSDR